MAGGGDKESVKEKLARLRAKRDGDGQRSSPQKAGASSSKGASSTPLDRLKRLKSKNSRKKLSVSTGRESGSKSGRRGGSRFGAPRRLRAGKDGDGVDTDEDDEEETDEASEEEESDLDEEGNPILKEEDKFAGMNRLVVVHPPKQVVPLFDLPAPRSVSIKGESHLVGKEDFSQDSSGRKGTAEGLLLDEGFYIEEAGGSRYKKSATALLRRMRREVEGEVEQRSVGEESKKLVRDAVNEEWFSESGALRGAPSMKRNVATRPVDSDPLAAMQASADYAEFDKLQTTFFSKPTLASVGIVPSSSEKRAGMRVCVSTLSFDDHPLFIEEDAAAARLRGIFRQYQRRVKVDLVHHLTQKLFSQIKCWKELGDEEMVARDAIAGDILRCFSERLSEELEIRLLAKAVYDQWLELKSVRNSQGFISTNAKLVVGRVASRTVHLSGDIFDAVTKCAEECKLKPRAAEKANEMLARYSATRTDDESQEYLFRFTDDGLYSKDDEVDAKELRRRRKVRQTRYSCRIKVNGNRVASTRSASLSWPSFRVEFDRTVHIQLMQRPKDIEVSIGTLDLSVLIPVPAADATGVLADTLGPQEEWYQFGGIRPMPKAKTVGKRSTLRDALLDSSADNVAMLGSLDERFTRGALRARALWVQLPNDDAQESGGQLGLPEKPKTRYTGKFIGGYESGLAGGAKGGGYLGVGEDAVSFDDAIPDFCREGDFLNLLKEVEKLDPNDPRNGGLLRLLDLAQQDTGDFFRMHALENQTLFKTGDRVAYQPANRSKLLVMRKEKPHLFQQPIPVLDSDIKKDEALQALLLPEDDTAEGSDHQVSQYKTRYGSTQRAARSKVHDFVQRVRQAQKGMGTRRQRDVRVSSIVKEGPLPAFYINWGIIKQLFQPRRRLKPSSVGRKPASMSVDKANIFCQVVRAVNVPVRKHAVQGGAYPPSPGRSPTNRDRSNFSSRRDSGDPDEDEDPDISAAAERVMSFVQVRFQGVARRSSSQEGPSPTWNESIFIPFVPPRKDFSPSNLKGIRDEVIVTLFDEVTVDSDPVDYRDEQNLFQKRERRYLGKVSIPFATIYENGRVEGMFRLDTPPVNLGYVTRDRGVPGNSGDGLKGHLKNRAANSTWCYLMVTLDPALATPADVDMASSVPTQGEPTKLLRHAEQWVKGIKKKNERTANANLQVIGTNIDGAAVFIPRFLHPQAPPDDYMGQPLDTPEKLARFVSLVPFLDDWNAFVDANDLYCTSQEFLDICAGDWEEHAILLRNYLAYVGAPGKHYIVMGTGIPEGDTVYVLSLDSTNMRDHVLWNASTGEGFVTSDGRVPLRDVSLVISDSNVWANIQEFGAPEKIRWNLANAKDWAPFWTRSFTKMELNTVQAGELEYKESDVKYSAFLEAEISDRIMRSMRRWRSKFGTTRFNKLVGRKLKTLLEDLEKQRLGVLDVTDAAHEAVLKEAMSTSDVFGFALNVTFTDMDSIVESVRHTDVHTMRRDNLQYAVAVKVFPYPCGVFSVWVYVCSLSSRRF